MVREWLSCRPVDHGQVMGLFHSRAELRKHKVDIGSLVNGYRGKDPGKLKAASVTTLISIDIWVLASCAQYAYGMKIVL